MTKTEGTMMALVAELKPREDNRRVGGMNEKALKELADSILQQGILNPITVRKDTMEIIAGERRWRAAQMAGLSEVPVTMVECTDEEALEIAAVENLQRADIHPLDEADEIIRMLGPDAAPPNGRSVEDVAAKIGKSTYYVRMRAALANLAPGPRKSFMKGGEDSVSLAHAMVLCRFPAHIQEEAWKRMSHWSPSDMQGRIEEQYFMDLAGAAFKKEDEGLVPEAGACFNCPKRTSTEPGLFPEVKKGERCLDAVCFNRKLDAHVAAVHKRMVQEKVDHLMVQGYYGEYGKKLPAEWIEPHAWQTCSKDDDGAMPCLVVTGPRRGKVVMGRKAVTEKGRKRQPAQSSEEAKVRRRELLEQRKKAATREALFRALGIAIRERPMPVEAQRVMMEGVFRRVDWASVQIMGKALGWEPEKNKNYGGYNWRGCAEKYMAAMTQPEEMLAFTVQCSIASGLMGGEEITRMAKMVGVDVAAVTKEAIEPLMEKFKKKEASRASKEKEIKAPAKKKAKAPAKK